MPVISLKGHTVLIDGKEVTFHSDLIFRKSGDYAVLISYDKVKYTVLLGQEDVLSNEAVIARTLYKLIYVISSKGGN